MNANTHNPQNKMDLWVSRCTLPPNTRANNQSDNRPNTNRTGRAFKATEGFMVDGGLNESDPQICGKKLRSVRRTRFESEPFYAPRDQGHQGRKRHATPGTGSCSRFKSRHRHGVTDSDGTERRFGPVYSQGCFGVSCDAQCSKNRGQRMPGARTRSLPDGGFDCSETDHLPRRGVRRYVLWPAGLSSRHDPWYPLIMCVGAQDHMVACLYFFSRPARCSNLTISILFENN
jgi:hypothetical protein